MLQKALDKVTDLAMLVAEVAIVLMMLHIAAELLVRWFFRGALEATNEIVTFYYMVACTYLPLAYVTRADGHISAQIFTDYMPARPREILEGVILLCLAAFMVIIVWATTIEAVVMTQVGETHQAATIYLAKWPARWYLPIGSGIMGLYALAMGLRKLMGSGTTTTPAGGAFKAAAHD